LKTKDFSFDFEETFVGTNTRKAHGSSETSNQVNPSPEFLNSEGECDEELKVNDKSDYQSSIPDVMLSNLK